MRCTSSNDIGGIKALVEKAYFVTCSRWLKLSFASYLVNLDKSQNELFFISEAHPHNRLTCDQSQQNYLKTWQNVQRFELWILTFSLQSMTMVVLTIESKSASMKQWMEKTLCIKGDDDHAKAFLLPFKIWFLLKDMPNWVGIGTNMSKIPRLKCKLIITLK